MDDLLKPSWLNASLLMTILQSANSNSPGITVLDWLCKHAVPAGSNYMSVLYRISIRYQIGQSNISSTNIIIKTPLESGFYKNRMEHLQGYEKEVKMYKEVLPAMYEMYNFQLTARSFDCPLHNVLALEDLTLQGYKMADRLKQLDPDHCILTLRSLARFHAASVRLSQKYPQLVKYFKRYDLKTKMDMFKSLTFQRNSMLRTIEEMKECEQYKDIIRSKVNNYEEETNKIFQNAYGLNVLCHGDVWVNNILFKYDNTGRVVDVKLLDFQMVHTSSFAEDVYNFWWSSANKDTRENHQAEMFEIYRTTLNQTFEELGCAEKLSKEQFDSIMTFYSPISINYISGILSVVLADPGDSDDYSQFTIDELNNETPIKEFYQIFFAKLKNVVLFYNNIYKGSFENKVLWH